MMFKKCKFKKLSFIIALKTSKRAVCCRMPFRVLERYSKHLTASTHALMLTSLHDYSVTVW